MIPARAQCRRKHLSGVLYYKLQLHGNATWSASMSCLRMTRRHSGLAVEFENAQCSRDRLTMASGVRKNALTPPPLTHFRWPGHVDEPMWLRCLCVEPRLRISITQWKRPVCIPEMSGAEPAGRAACRVVMTRSAHRTGDWSARAPVGAARRADPSRCPAGARWARSRLDPAASCVWGWFGVSR